MPQNTDALIARYRDVVERFSQANRLDCASLLAVSKTFPKEDLLTVALAGQRSFGENYAQEGCDKVRWFKDNHPELSLVWHFIGPLQSNKTRMVAEHFDWVQSVNRLKIAQRLNDQRPESMKPLNVLVEVNIDDETTKSGASVEELPILCEAIQKMPRLKLRGLMAIPEPRETSEERMIPLRAMRLLFDRYRERFGFDTLSMGMTHDMLEALSCGATLVRIGTAIFGGRDYSKKH